MRHASQRVSLPTTAESAPRNLLGAAITRQLDSDRSRPTQDLLRFILAERPAVRLLDKVLRRTHGTRIPIDFAVLNGLRCFARPHARGIPGGILACAVRPNERRAVAALHTTLGDIAWNDLDFELRPSFDLERLAQLGSRVRPIARRLAATQDLFQMLRAVELICYHERFGELLDLGRYRAVAISSFNNPWGIAMHAAARRRQIPVILVTHATPVLPITRLDYDLAIVDNAASHDAFTNAGCRIDRTIIKSAQAAYRPMPAAFPAGSLTAGVFLSKDPDARRVIAWIERLLAHDRIGSVLVRPHPANQWAGVRDAVAGFARGRVVLGTHARSFDDLARCHLIIAGNSAVHVEAVTAGTPSILVPGLDGADRDSYGFVEHGLVPRAELDTDLALDDVLAFYRRPEWERTLRRYANIARSDADVAQDIRTSVQAITGL